MENRYDFKKELLQVHKKDLRDYKISPEADDFVFTDGLVIQFSGSADGVVDHAAWVLQRVPPLRQRRPCRQTIRWLKSVMPLKWRC